MMRGKGAEDMRSVGLQDVMRDDAWM